MKIARIQQIDAAIVRELAQRIADADGGTMASDWLMMSDEQLARSARQFGVA